MWKLGVTVHAEAEEAASELLGHILKVSPTSYIDLKTEKAHLSFFFRAKPQFDERLQKSLKEAFAKIRTAGLPVGSPRPRLNKVPPRDWAESWKRHFKPIEIGDELLILPSWSKRKANSGQAVVVLDPGLSFGTGQHATTSFCLNEIVKLRRRRKTRKLSLLDVGTGSGILAIAAAKLGYEPVEAFDFDPVAVRVARANAAGNGVTRRIRISKQDAFQLTLTPRRQYSIVCANLISNLLVDVSKRLAAQLQPGGTLAVAGILKAEFPIVQRTFESLGLHLTASRAEAEWRSGAFLKPV
jgi:ribosomal protein L11 methyltransferase